VVYDPSFLEPPPLPLLGSPHRYPLLPQHHPHPQRPSPPLIEEITEEEEAEEEEEEERRIRAEAFREWQGRNGVTDARSPYVAVGDGEWWRGDNDGGVPLRASDYEGWHPPPTRRASPEHLYRPPGDLSSSTELFARLDRITRAFESQSHRIRQLEARVEELLQRREQPEQPEGKLAVSNAPTRPVATPLVEDVPDFLRDVAVRAAPPPPPPKPQDPFADLMREMERVVNDVRKSKEV
jgi:hypothetical protein